jgi:hypothetical protein
LTYARDALGGKRITLADGRLAKASNGYIRAGSYREYDGKLGLRGSGCLEEVPPNLLSLHTTLHIAHISRQSGELFTILSTLE